MLVPLEPPRRDVSFADNPRDSWFHQSRKASLAGILNFYALATIKERENWLKQYASKNPADSADVREFLADMANIRRKIEQLMKEADVVEKEIGDWVNEGWKGL